MLCRVTYVTSAQKVMIDKGAKEFTVHSLAVLRGSHGCEGGGEDQSVLSPLAAALVLPSPWDRKSMDIKTQYYVSKKRGVQGRARINTQSVALKEEYTKKQNEEKRLESKENMHQKEIVLKMVLKKVEFNEEYCKNVVLLRG